MLSGHPSSLKKCDRLVLFQFTTSIQFSNHAHCGCHKRILFLFTTGMSSGAILPSDSLPQLLQRHLQQCLLFCAVWSCPKIVNINFFGWKAIHIQFWQASSAGDTISHFTKNENSLFVAFTFNFVTKNRCPCKWSFCIIELQIQIQIPGMIVDKVRVTSHRNFSIIIDGSARERGERDLMANSWLTRTIRKNCIELSIVRIRDN